MLDCRKPIEDLIDIFRLSITCNRSNPNDYRPVISVIGPLINMLFETHILSTNISPTNMAGIESNVLLDTVNEEYINIPLYVNANTKISTEDMVTYIMETFNTVESEAYAAIDLIDVDIVKPIMQYVKNTSTNIYSLNIHDSGMITVNDRGNVKSIRYDEFCDVMDSNGS